jgi:tetratricopeptide (TPR) repeat protein
MGLTPGTRLGAYQIVAPLGAGGMGEVYRATDTRLGREVAVKVVSERLADDPQALARLEREARNVAVLSHPNIVALYDVGQERGIVFAVMELLEGEPLERALATERLPWKRALEVAVSIADALASAHTKGLVHRDLKPANIFITRDGVVKLLDFGLAKQDPFRSPFHGDGPTAAADTQPGAIIGTVGYMSPEQVRGEGADHRSDIFSFGCVLYEILAGRKPFSGATPAETLAAILRDQPSELAAAGRQVPPRVEAVLRRCLEKNPDQRFQSARDLAFAMREILQEWGARSSSTGPSTGRPRVRRGAVLATAALLIALAAVASFEVLMRSRPSPTGDVARAVAREVDVTLTPEGSAGLTAATRNILPAAYEAYVRGRHAWDKRGESDLREGIRYFQQSIDADPTYAPAYAGLADCYAQLGYGSYITPEDAFPRAREAARKALDLDPTLAEAHASLGYALMYYDWNFTGAETEFKRAIELNPNYAIAHQWYAYLLTAMERPLSDAEGEIARAKALDPLSVPINIDRAYILHYYERNDEALRSVRLALEMNPKYAPGYFWLGRIYTSQGRYADADAALEHIGALRTWTPAMAVRGYLYAKSGRPHDAKNLLAEFDDLVRQGRYASSYAIAIVYAGLGDRERVFSYLDAAYRERSHWLVWLKRDPRWNDVRSDPRFHRLVQQIGLPH